MRARTVILAAAILAAGCGGAGKSTTQVTGPRPTGVSVTIVASTHHPKVNARWPYEVKANARGKLTVVIVDPVGGVHAVDYDNTKRKVKDFDFNRSFRDYLEFPPDSQGYRLTVRATVTTSTGTGQAGYWVKSR